MFLTNMNMSKVKINRNKAIRKCFDASVDVAARLTSLIFRIQIIEIIKLFINKTQWYAIKRRFGAVGDRSYIEAPFNVINPQNVFIGTNFSALSTLTIETWEEYLDDKFTPKIIIGNNVSFYHDCHIGCINRVEIGDNVLLASKVYITDHFHGNISLEDFKHAPVARELFSKGPVIIERNAWIGECVAIMPGVTIGENAIIGANSVVTRSIPPNSIAAGVPAKIIKEFQEPGMTKDSH